MFFCEVIAPPHTGYTSTASPTLFWYTNATTSRFKFALVDDDAIEPLLELKMADTEIEGFHQLDLAKHGVKLEAGKIYQWSVAVVADKQDRSADIVASGTVTFEPPAEQLTQQLNGQQGVELTRAYAEAGYWYDAFASLWLPAGDGESGMNSQLMSSLINQVGLDQVATAISLP